MFSKASFLKVIKSRDMCGNDQVKKKTYENIVGNWKNAGYQHFLLFLQCFLPDEKRMFIVNLISLLQMLSVWTKL